MQVIVFEHAMSIARARIAVASLFVALSIIGVGLVFSYWSSESTTTAAYRSILFVAIMAGVHLAGYWLYVEQHSLECAEAASPAPFQYALQYWPSLKQAILLQMLFGVLTALMLDGGRSFDFFKVASLGHWIAIILIIVRRPLAPTRFDIFIVRWGVLLLLLVVVYIASLVWSIIGESDLSGWERLWH